MPSRGSFFNGRIALCSGKRYLHNNVHDSAENDDIRSALFGFHCHSKDDLDLATLLSVSIDVYLREASSPNTRSDDKLGGVSIPAPEVAVRDKHLFRPNVQYRRHPKPNKGCGLSLVYFDSTACFESKIMFAYDSLFVLNIRLLQP
jgi:hypothetical protein